MPYTPGPGDIGLVKMAGSVGRLIQWGQWLNGGGTTFSPFDEQYHHAFVHVGYTKDEHFDHVIEAMPGGALLTPLSYYTRRQPVLWLRCPEEYRAAVAAAALKYRGTPYSAADYFALAAHRFHLPVPGLRRYIARSRSMICSQLCDQAALDGGWHIFDDGRWPGYVTPIHLASLANRQEIDRMRSGGA